MRYTEQEIKERFSQWCKVMGVKEGTEIGQVGAYIIPSGIMGWGIARYVNEAGGIHVIMCTSKREAFMDMLEFAIQSKQISKGN